MYQGNVVAACPECGAAPMGGLSCWENLGVIIAWEYQDADLLAAHFLTVASYNLQHPAQFRDEAIAGLRDAFIAHLEHRLPVATIRRRTAAAAAGQQRVKRPAAERCPVLRHWTMTIADVALPNQPQGAATRVRAWAAAICHDLHTNTFMSDETE